MTKALEGSLRPESWESRVRHRKALARPRQAQARPREAPAMLRAGQGRAVRRAIYMTASNMCN